MGEGGSCLWRHLLTHKYKLEGNGWAVPGMDYKAYGIWKSILFVKGVFISGLVTKFMMSSRLNSGMMNGVGSGF